MAEQVDQDFVVPIAVIIRPCSVNYWQSIIVNTSTKTLAAAKDAITTQLNFKEVSIYVRDNSFICAKKVCKNNFI